MLSPRLRLDLSPRCDRHPDSVMVPVMMQMKPGNNHHWFPAYVCVQHNCPRHFNTVEGYFSVFKQRTDPDTNRRMPCPEDAFPMYLADYDPHSHVWSWRCAQLGCHGSSIEVGSPVHVRAQQAWR